VHLEKARPRGSPGPFTPPSVSGPETQRISEVSEGWQFAHTARIWRLLKGKKSTAGSGCLGRKADLCLTVKQAASLEVEKRKNKSGLALPVKDFLDNAGEVGSYMMCKHTGSCGLHGQESECIAFIILAKLLDSFHYFS